MQTWDFKFSILICLDILYRRISKYCTYFVANFSKITKMTALIQKHNLSYNYITSFIFVN